MEIKEARPVNEMLEVLKTVEIGHKEDGTVWIKNEKLAADTLEAWMETKKDIVINSDINSILAGQDLYTQTNGMVKKIKDKFKSEKDRLKIETDKIRIAEKSIAKPFEQYAESIKMQVMYMKEQWKLQAIQDYQRDCSVDLLPEMFSGVKIRIDSAKKTIEHNVMLRVQEIEEEYAQRQADEDALEQCCRLQNLDFNMYKTLLETKTLAETLDYIAEQQEEANRRQAAIEVEERRRKAQEEQAIRERQARQTIVNEVVPTLQDVTPDYLEPDIDPFILETPEEPLMRWIVEITTTPSKQQLLSQFCRQHGIDVRVPDGIASNY